MSDFKILHNRPGCIGCGACAAVAPEFWVMDYDECKSDVKDANRRKDGWEEKEMQGKDLEINKEAAQSCPVRVIHLKDKAGNELV